jgi:hypothetical protein
MFMWNRPYYLSQYLPRGTEENQENSVRNLQAEIQNQDLPNTKEWQPIDSDVLSLGPDYVFSVGLRDFRTPFNWRSFALVQMQSLKIINSSVAGNHTYKKFWHENLLVDQKGGNTRPV